MLLFSKCVVVLKKSFTSFDTDAVNLLRSSYFPIDFLLLVFL